MKSSWVGYILLAMMILSVSLSAEAVPPHQTPTPRTIAYGDTITDKLEDTSGDAWSFAGTAGDVIAIRVQSGIDTTLDLYDSAGTLLATNDDYAGGGLDARIENYILPATDTYVFLLKGNTTAAYTLSFTGGARELLPLTYGTTGSDSLSEDLESDLWTFDGELGDAVSITVSAEFSSALELYDARGNLIIANVNYRDHNGRIVNQTLPTTGHYLIIVYRYATGADEYTIALDAVTANSRILTYNKTVTAEFITPESHTWSFEGQTSDIVALGTQTSNLDTYLQLYSPSGELIAANDDLFLHDAYIGETVLPEDGTYLVLVYEITGTLGSYTLTLTQKESVLDVARRELRYGDSAATEIPAQGDDQWSFTGQAGDRVTIGIHANFYAFIEIRTPSGTILAGDRQNYFTDAYVPDLVLPATGSYRITVRSITLNPEDRAYTIGLLGQTQTAQLIEYGETLAGGVKPDIDAIYEFEGTAGDIVTIRDEEERAVYFTLYDARGWSLGV